MKDLRFVETGRIIRKLRLKKGLTQKELASNIGYTNEQNVSAMERGIAGIPKKKIDLMAKSLGVPRRRIINAVMRQQKASM